MNVLIVEDDDYKFEALESFLYEEIGDVKLTKKESLASGLFEVLDNPNFDLILLDMSMPSFDISTKDPEGGSPESYAGEDFVAQMSVLGLNIPTIVVTQYDNFENDKVHISLKELNERLFSNYSNFYHGSVFYKTTNNYWKSNLKDKILSIFK